MKKDLIYSEAKRLHQMGFGIHWLHKESKRPIESKWTTGPRKDWKYLVETYIDGLNVGVRLGSASKIKGKYLAVIDVDVKSLEKKHRLEVNEKLHKLFGKLPLPEVTSGRGGGSRHYYILTDKPVIPTLAAQSKELIKVLMPSANNYSRRDAEHLSEKELAKGYRMRPAWEIGLMGEGQQVVLPPSIHPDSKKPYAWKKVFNSKAARGYSTESIQSLAEKAKAEMTNSNDKSSTTVEDVSFEKINLDEIDIRQKYKDMILTCKGVTDRSSMLLPIAHELHRAGLGKDEILSVLTDTDNDISGCAYDHAQTTSRRRAAQWVWKYTVRKVIWENSSAKMFEAPVDNGRELSKAEMIEQEEELDSLFHWTEYLDKTDRGKLRPTFKNGKLMLANVLKDQYQEDNTDPLLLGRNEFAGNDYWLNDTPWFAKKGNVVTDHDILAIKDWCINTHGCEFSINTINETVMNLASEFKWHPVRDYLESLEWDGVERIDTWLEKYAYAKGPKPYLNEVSRKVLVAMVARVMEPGIKFDHVLILEGRQGAGKSSIVNALAGDWFSDVTLNIGDKDGILAMQSKWVIELGELSTMSRTDIDLLKAFVTQTHDRMRPPYGRRVEEYPRQCIFIGTTNNKTYLKDPTGNRRFWPVAVGSDINWGEVKEVRDQLFAEAFAKYAGGEELFLSEEASRQATEEQMFRSVVDEWTGVIRDVLASDYFTLDKFEIKDLAKHLDEIGATKLTPSDVQRISNSLTLLGYERRRETKKPSKENDFKRRYFWTRKSNL